jgi:phage gp36-like protein
MSWITITSTDVQTRLTGVELSALQKVALAPGQPDPLDDVISKVVDEVRGYIAANPKNTLGGADTVPQKLLSASLAIIRYRLATRLPVKSILTEDRVKENADAIRLLERVADGKFAVEDPVTGDTAGISIQLAYKPTRIATREKLSGL